MSYYYWYYCCYYSYIKFKALRQWKNDLRRATPPMGRPKFRLRNPLCSRYFHCILSSPKHFWNSIHSEKLTSTNGYYMFKTEIPIYQFFIIPLGRNKSSGLAYMITKYKALAHNTGLPCNYCLTWNFKTKVLSSDPSLGNF